jgi:hypothetical protein
MADVSNPEIGPIVEKLADRLDAAVLAFPQQWMEAAAAGSETDVARSPQAATEIWIQVRNATLGEYTREIIEYARR